MMNDPTLRREYPAGYYAVKERLHMALRDLDERAHQELTQAHAVRIVDPQATERIFREHNERRQPILDELARLEAVALLTVVIIDIPDSETLASTKQLVVDHWQKHSADE